MSYLLLAVNNSHGKSLSKSSAILDQWLNRVSPTCWYGTLSKEGLDEIKGELTEVVTRAMSVQFFWLHKHDFRLIGSIGRAQQSEKAWAPIGNVLSAAKPRPYQRHEAIVRDLAIVAGLVHDIGKAKADTQRVYRGLQRFDQVRHEIPSALWFSRWASGGRSFAWDDLRWKRDGSWPSDSLIRVVFQSVISHHGLPNPFISDEGVPVTCGYSLHRLQEGAGGEGVISLISVQGDERRPVFSETWGNTLDRHYSALTSPSVDGVFDRSFEGVEFVATSEEYYYFVHRSLLMLADAAESAFESNSDAQLEKHSRVLYSDTGQSPLQEGQVYAKSSRLVPLVDHLRGVGDFARKAAYFLFLRPHPRILRLPGSFGAMPQNGSPFYWQNRSRYIIKSVQQRIGSFEGRGFFGCVTSQTGVGKTRGCYGILSALSEDRPRFTLGLGYGALAVQSATAYRKDIGLTPDECGVMVGRRHQDYLREALAGSGQGRQDEVGGLNGPDGEVFLQTLAAFERDLEGGSVAPNVTDIHRLLFREAKKSKGRLVDTPVVVMTIDHISGAMNPSKGSFLPAILRVATADLIIDEVDSFSPFDLHGLSRLVYFSGLFGRKVLLSSATLPPEISGHFHSMYAKGYRAYQLASGAPDYAVGFFNDLESTGYARIMVSSQGVETGGQQGVNGAPDASSFDSGDPELRPGCFLQEYLRFHQSAGVSSSRTVCHEVVACKASFGAIGRSENSHSDLFPNDLMGGLLAEILQLGEKSHEVMEGVPVSLGVLRLSHVKDVQRFVRSLTDADLENDQWLIRFQPLHGQLAHRVRNHVQTRFSHYLNRKDTGSFWEALCQDHPALVSQARSSQKGVLIVMVATSVVEVGVDYDFDWVLAEPATLGALIQLAGRCLRHRRHKSHHSAVRLLPFTLKEYFGKEGFQRFSNGGLMPLLEGSLLDLEPPKSNPFAVSNAAQSSPLSKLASAKPVSASFFGDSDTLVLSNHLRLLPPVIPIDCVERMRIDCVFGASRQRDKQLGHFLREPSPFSTSRYLLGFRSQSTGSRVILINRDTLRDELLWTPAYGDEVSPEGGAQSLTYPLSLRGLLITDDILGSPGKAPDEIAINSGSGGKSYLYYSPALGAVWSAYQLDQDSQSL